MNQTMHNGIKPKDMQVNEIFEELEKINSDANKVELLRTKYSDHIPLHRVLKMNFCDDIVPVLPAGRPPFNDEALDGPARNSLWSYVRQFQVFVKSGQSMKMKPTQIEGIFIEMLEAIDVEEAEMMCLAKDKSLTTKWNIKVEIIQEAFPLLNIRQAKAPIKMTSAEKANTLKTRAAEKKALAKRLTEEAQTLTKEANKLVGEV